MDYAFKPMWCSPPGSTIQDILNAKGISVDHLAKHLDTRRECVLELLSAHVSITEDVAARLADGLGGTKDFWLNREKQYQEDFDRLQRAVTDKEAELWLNRLPLADMVAFGWVEPHRKLRVQFVECLKFFGVANIEMWMHRYADVLESARFRTSKAYASDPAAVAAWLRRGEALAEQLSCSVWNKEAFRESLRGIRGISRLKDPTRFLPKLTKACAECGVALIVHRVPSGCRASGATRFLTNSKAMMILSFRYLSDDQFWFTFFHEAGHLILHDKEKTFLEGIGKNSEQEHEADQFAESVIIPPDARHEFDALKCTYKAVADFAHRMGIAPGIIVGQLQHRGRVPRNKLNRLKNRYRWT